MAETEEKKYLINVESNLDEYVKDLQKVNVEVEKFKSAQKEAEKQSGKNSEEYIKATAQLKSAQTEQRQATSTLTKMTTAQKSAGTSYNDLHKIWQAAELTLKQQQGTIIRNADGTIRLSDAYKKAKLEAMNAKEAVDKFNLGVNNGTSSVGQYSKGLKDAIGQTGLLGGINLSSGFLIAGAAIAGLWQGLKTAIQYTVQFEKSLSNLKALTGASSDDMKFYKQAAKELGDQFGKTGKDMVETFKIIGSAKPELLKSKEGLVAVSAAANALSYAAGIEVPDAANSLVLAMNQFGAPASEANRYINAMAAGAKEGAAEIPDLSESLVKFGSVAAALNIPIEQSVGLIEALAEKGIKAEQAGTGLKSFLLKLEQGAKNTRPSVVGLEKALSNLKEKNMSVNEAQKMFGLETANVALALISQSDRVKELTKAVTGTNEAFVQAAINQDNVGGASDRLKAKWTNFVDSVINSKGVLSSFFKNLLYDMSQVLDGLADLFKSSREKSIESLGAESKATIDLYKKYWESDKNLLTLKQDMAEFSDNQAQWESRLAMAKKKNDQDEIDKASEKIKMYKSLIELGKSEYKTRTAKPKPGAPAGGADDSKASKKAASDASAAWTKYYNDRKALLDAEKILSEGQYTRMVKSINDLSNLELEKAKLTSNQRFLLETQRNKALSDLEKQYFGDKKEIEKEYVEFQKTISSDVLASEKDVNDKLIDQKKTDGQARVDVARLNADNEYAVSAQANQKNANLLYQDQQTRLSTLRDILDDETAALVASDEYKKASVDQRALWDAQYAAQRIAISNDMVNFEIANDKRLLDQKKQTFASTADLLGATSELIGKETVAGKSMAIAQAVINTYLAASNALASAPNPIIGAIQVAAAVAIGLAQVKQIMAVKVGKNANNNVSGGGGSGRTVSASFTAANQNIASSQVQSSRSDRLGGIQQNANNQAVAINTAQQPIRVESVISVEAFQSQAEKKNQVEVKSNI